MIRAPQRNHFRVPQPGRSGTVASELKKVHKAYGETVVYRGVDSGCSRDRVALVGQRRGQEHAPQRLWPASCPSKRDRMLGQRLGPTTTPSSAGCLNPGNRVLEELASVAGIANAARRRGDPRGGSSFRGRVGRKRSPYCRGASRSRLALAKRLCSGPANLLCLDERHQPGRDRARDPGRGLDQIRQAPCSSSRTIATSSTGSPPEWSRSATGGLYDYAGITIFPGESGGRTAGSRQPAAAGRGPRGDRTKRGAAAAGRGAGRNGGRERERGRSEADRRGPGAQGRRGVGKRGSAKGADAGGQARRSGSAPAKSREVAPLRARLKEIEADIARIEARVRDLTDQMANPDLYKTGPGTRGGARAKGSGGAGGLALRQVEELAVRLEAPLPSAGRKPIGFFLARFPDNR